MQKVVAFPREGGIYINTMAKSIRKNAMHLVGMERNHVLQSAQIGRTCQ